MGRPAAVEIRASRRLRNSDCHAATAMPCTTMGKSCWLSGECVNLTGSGPRGGGGTRGSWRTLAAGRASFKSFVSVEEGNKKEGEGEHEKIPRQGTIGMGEGVGGGRLLSQAR